MENKIAALRDHYIICGFGRVGSRIAEDFTAARKPFVVIDENESNVRNCASHGYLVLQGDATSDEILREAGVQHAKCLLVATENDANRSEEHTSELQSLAYLVCRLLLEK